MIDFVSNLSRAIPLRRDEIYQGSTSHSVHPFLILKNHAPLLDVSISSWLTRKPQSLSFKEKCGRAVMKWCEMAQKPRWTDTGRRQRIRVHAWKEGLLSFHLGPLTQIIWYLKCKHNCCLKQFKHEQFAQLHQPTWKRLNLKVSFHYAAQPAAVRHIILSNTDISPFFWNSPFISISQLPPLTTSPSPRPLYALDPFSILLPVQVASCALCLNKENISRYLPAYRCRHLHAPSLLCQPSITSL